MKIVLKNAVKISRQIISQVVSVGDTVVDATCGQGHDTLFLAELVGLKGLVYSFDIQDQAIKSAKNLLAANNFAQTVKFINDDHARIKNYVDKRINAAMFNLGYLPGGDHRITTKPETTIEAVSSALQLLEVGGLVTIVAYPGHQAGETELKELRNYLRQIPQQQFEIIEVAFLNQINNPPEIIIAQKVKETI